MFAYMCNEHINKNSNNYVWFLVHRQELIFQTIKTFKDNGLDTSKVLIAMVQTVSRHLDKYEKPSMIVFDEAHHASANTWTKIIDVFPNIPIVGLTATPCRMDGKPLGHIFDSLIEGPSAQWLIDNHYLSDFDYYAPKVFTAELKVKGSDYDMQDVSNKMFEAQIYGDVLKYIDINRKTIIYSPSIKYSEELAIQINNKFGHICEHFDGGTDDSERKDIIEKFRNGELRVLTNVDLIGEGFDVPDCDCCILLRPTLSTSLYIQQSMRCLRYRENKRAIIYDLVGNCFRHGLPTNEREWSLDKVVKVRNKTEDRELVVRECKHCLRVYKGNSRICPYCGSDNGKTRKEIEQDEKAELERITAINKKRERMEVGMCRDFGSLVRLAIQRGYDNPQGWAYNILKARKLKNI